MTEFGSDDAHRARGAAGTAPARAGPRSRRLAVTELKLFGRERAGSFWGVAFPLCCWSCSANPGFRTPASKSLGGLNILDAYVPILIAFVLAILALNALPAALAGYREKGYLRRLATTPVGPGRVLAAQLAVNFGGRAGRWCSWWAWPAWRSAWRCPARRPGSRSPWCSTAAALFGLGLLIGAVAPTGRAANAIGALLFFPMMFFAGLWVPRRHAAGAAACQPLHAAGSGGPVAAPTRGRATGRNRCSCWSGGLRPGVRPGRG